MNKRRWKVYAPVIIPTLCRYEHFKRCVDSLSRNTGAEFTELYIGLDYPFNESHVEGYKKICEYVSEIKGFKQVHIFKREINFGPERNHHDLEDKVRKEFDRYIFSEDDNEFSPNFLEYMNACLERYKDNPNIIRICGSLFTWGVDYKNYMSDYPYNAFPSKGYNASGVGVWFDKPWQNYYTKTRVLNSPKLALRIILKGYSGAVNRFIYQLHRNSELPDLGLRLYCVFNDKYCIFPIVSKVKNWGYDGTGLNSDNNPKLTETIVLDTDLDFKLDEFQIKDYPGVKKVLRRMFHAPQGQPFFCLKVLVSYFFYKITGARPQDFRGKKQKLRALVMKKKIGRVHN